LIIHCTRRLAAKLPDVSAAPLEDTSPLGNWHAHLYHIDRRQCVLFCHDESRFVLFLPGLKKEQFAELGNNWFKPLFAATLAALGCSQARVSRAELALGAVRFDTATDRSVLSAMNIAFDHELYPRVARVPNVLNLEPIAISCEMSDRPTWIRRKPIWPDRRMLEIVAAL